ncbi:MAG: archaeal heat shock protein Hsp20 [Desulfurococcaceae archaeon]
MSDEWWYRRRRRSWEDDLWWELDRIFEDMERMFRELTRRFFELTPERVREFEREFEKMGIKPYVYGFSITIGPDGRPIIQEFGNIKKIRGKPIISEEREPLVDVFETADEVTVIAEIPGVEKEKIDLKVSEDGKTLIINASNEKRKYFKEVELPARVDPSSATASYKNGVLEVKLKKSERGGKGVKIKVE